MSLFALVLLGGTTIGGPLAAARRSGGLPRTVVHRSRISSDCPNGNPPRARALIVDLSPKFCLTELRLEQYDELVIAIRVSRLFTGEKFTGGSVTVLLDHGQIVAVESGRVELDESWDIAEYESATVLPGLIDTHVHLVADSKLGALDRVPGFSDQELDAVITDGLRRQLAAGVTTVRDLGDRHYAVVARRDLQRAGRASEPEPTIVASGPPLTTVGGHCDYLGGEVATRRQISTAIRERVEREVDVIKVMASGGIMSPKKRREADSVH